MPNDDHPLSEVLEDIVGNIQGIIRSAVRRAEAEIQLESVKACKAAGVTAFGAVLALYA